MKQTEQLPGMEDPPDDQTIRTLVRLGYKEAIVSQWPRSKAVVVMEARLKEEAIRFNKAARYDDKPEKPLPDPYVLPAAREDAAAYLEMALESPSKGELHLALSYCAFALEHDEADRLAAFMAKKFRGQT